VGVGPAVAVPVGVSVAARVGVSAGAGVEVAAGDVGDSRSSQLVNTMAERQIVRDTTSAHPLITELYGAGADPVSPRIPTTWRSSRSLLST
jgi:hypothetical protein